MISLHIPSMIVGFCVGLLAGGVIALCAVFTVEEKEDQKSIRINFSKGWDYGYQHGVEDTKKELDVNEAD